MLGWQPFPSLSSFQRWEEKRFHFLCLRIEKMITSYFHHPLKEELLVSAKDAPRQKKQHTPNRLFFLPITLCYLEDCHTASWETGAWHTVVQVVHYICTPNLRGHQSHDSQEEDASGMSILLASTVRIGGGGTFSNLHKSAVWASSSPTGRCARPDTRGIGLPPTSSKIQSGKWHCRVHLKEIHLRMIKKFYKTR